MNSPLSLEDVLAESGKISAEQLKRATLTANETGQGLGYVLTQLGLLTERALGELYVDILQEELLTAKEYPDELSDLHGLTPQYLRRVRALPINISDDSMIVAMADPLDASAIRALSYTTEHTIIPVPALFSEIDTVLAKYFPEDASVAEEQGAVSESDSLRLQDSASGAPVIRFVDRLVSEAVEQKASDIHLEATDTELRVRVRVDGVLQERESPFSGWRDAVISRVKLLAGLNIAEKRLPQDGRIRMAVRGQEIDLRVATTPTVHGESITIRILDQGQLALDFSELGFDEALLHQFKKILDNPAGMILVTGPTGSGKTTTLYTSLDYLNSPELKILTVEDPVEYMLEGANQVQIKPEIGLTFANALRSFLRLDPDVLLVGEIRDLETAEIAVQASLTGHRVLSTLHTNDAATGVTRLLDMGVAEYLISSTVTAILAQRLVRKLCPHCRKMISLSLDLVQKYGLNETDQVGQAVGCDHCNHTGYAGRSVILELLPITEKIRSLILQRAESQKIYEAARKESMRTIFEHGLEKAVRGETSMDEVLRVVGDITT